MRPLRYALLALMLLAAPAWAAPVKGTVALKIDGDTVIVVKSLPCTVTAPFGADLYFWTLPDGVKGTTADNVLTVTAAPAGDSIISVVSLMIDFDLRDGKITKTTRKDSGSIVLTSGVAPPAPPVPPDPLTAAFQSAYALDTDVDRVKSFGFLAAAYAGLAGQAASRSDLKTNVDFVAWVKTVVSAPAVGLTTTQLHSLRTAVGVELARVWGSTAAPLAPADAAAELSRIATALKGVK